MSFVVKQWGIKWIDVVMPPCVMGAVVTIIGLELAPFAAQQAGLAPWPTAIGKVVQPFVINNKAVIISMSTLFIGIFGSVMFRGFIQVIVILIAVLSAIYWPLLWVWLTQLRLAMRNGLLCPSSMHLCSI